MLQIKILLRKVHKNQIYSNYFLIAVLVENSNVKSEQIYKIKKNRQKNKIKNKNKDKKNEEKKFIVGNSMISRVN